MKKSELNKNIKIAGIAGIIALVLSIPSNILSILIAFDIKSDLITNLLIITLLIATILNITFLRGFVLTGTKIKNSFLVKASYIVAVATIIYVGGGITSIFIPSLENMLVGIGLLWIYGISSIIFGIGLLKSKNSLGNLAMWAGVLDIISGITYISVILFFVGVMISYIAMILEIMILFKTSKKL